VKRYYHPILFCMFFTSLFELFRRAFLLTGRELSISNRPLIVFSPDSGLGNNMIALVSSKFLAEIVQSPFAIVWENSSTLACQAAYTDTFTDSGYNLPEARLRERCPSLCDLDLTQSGSNECWNMINCDTAEQIADSFKSCTCVRIRSNQYFLEPLAKRISVKQNPFSFYAEDLFIPAESLAEQVKRTREEWKVQHNVSHVIGVHVRSAFYATDIKNGHLIPKEKVFETHFWPCVQKIASNLAGERVGVFVAADTANLRREAAEIIRSSNDVFLLKSPISNIPNDTGLGPTRNKNEVVDAAIELFLLQTSDSVVVKRVGRFDSTFSAVAVAQSLCDSSGKCYIVGDHSCERTIEPQSPDLHHVVEANCNQANLAQCFPVFG
jgi:hypothetical protein